MGSKIKHYRKKKNLTQKELAEAVGLSHANSISDIENDVFYPRYAVLYKIAGVLDVSLDDLVADYLKKNSEDFEGLTQSHYNLYDSIDLADLEVLNKFYEAFNDYKKLKKELKI